MNKKIYFIILLIFLFRSMCLAGQNGNVTGRSNKHVFLKTPTDGMTFKQIYTEINKQTGVIILVTPDLKNIIPSVTLEVNFNDIDVFEAFKIIEIQIKNKYDHEFIIVREDNTLIATHYKPYEWDSSIVFIKKIKNISAFKIQKIIFENTGNRKGVAADMRTNSIIFWIERKNEILKLIDKYDVELNNINKSVIKSTCGQ